MAEAPARPSVDADPFRAAAGEPLLSIRGIGKRFGATRALDDVSIDVRAGEIHCVLGENGAGKSSLGKIVAGLYRADSGVVRFDGREVQHASPRQARAAGIAIVYQELSLVPDLSIRANFWLGSEPVALPWGGIGRRREGPRVQAILAQLGLDLDPETRVKNLPVTTQQLLEIGKSLMHAPRLVIFDEPTAMLGAVEKQRFFGVLCALRERGIASILVTHHIDDVMEVGDCVTVMRDGRVVESFPIVATTSADDVLERLTGRRAAAPAVRAAHRGESPVVLEIAGVPGREGPRTLRIPRGGIVGFYGVVGCGASHVLYAAGGLEPAPELSMQLGGRPYRPRDPSQALRRGVSSLPAGRQAHGILPGRSIRENLMLSQLGRGGLFGFIDRRREAATALEQLRACGVKFADIEQGIETLSGGNQQKVLLARAMAGARALLLLEEPTAGVDVEAKHQIHERIRAAAAAGMAVVVLSSDLPETLALCDTVHTFFAGKAMGRYEHPGAADHAAIVADILGQHGGETPAPPAAVTSGSPAATWSLSAT